MRYPVRAALTARPAINPGGEKNKICAVGNCLDDSWLLPLMTAPGLEGRDKKALCCERAAELHRI